METKGTKLKPTDFGIKKLSTSDSKLQKIVWFNQMQKFFEEFDREDEGGNKTWRNKDRTYLLLIDSVERDMLEKVFHSKRAEFNKCHDTQSLFKAIHSHIS